MHLHQSCSEEPGAASAVTNATTARLNRLPTPRIFCVCLTHPKYLYLYLFRVEQDHESICGILVTMGATFGGCVSY